MAVEAQLGTELVIDPQNVRYSLTVDRLGDTARQRVDLQRSMKREDGTWVDDPLPTSKNPSRCPPRARRQLMVWSRWSPPFSRS